MVVESTCRLDLASETLDLDLQKEAEGMAAEREAEKERRMSGEGAALVGK